MKTIQELETMSDDELRVMLAELDGWTRHDKHEDGFGAGQRLTTGWKDSKGLWLRKLPDYPADLNACHAVLHAITPAQHSAYQVHLADLSGTFRNAIDAPPRERTIALIFTLQQTKP